MLLGSMNLHLMSYVSECIHVSQTPTYDMHVLNLSIVKLPPSVSKRL